jgi:Domain of unknown function (DUF4291)
VLPTQPYLEQLAHWPCEGEHILAHFDAHSIVVYQAYRSSIADHATRHGKLGGPDFSFDRMSWIKPNFLWMMYRSGWATKDGQDRIVGLRIRKTFFDSLLEAAVFSAFAIDRHADHAAWRAAIATSEVRQQWDPDHDPSGASLARRAIQLGLRGETLRRFATEEVLEVIDMTTYVIAQRRHACDGYTRLQTPIERVYLPQTGTIVAR